MSPHVWTPPICLDTPHLFGCAPCMFGCPICMGAYGHQCSLTNHAFFVLCMYRGIQTYGGVQTYREAYGGIQTYRGPSKHMGASKCMGAYGHPLSLTNHAFFVLCMYRGIQTYGGCPSIQGHPNIGDSLIYRGIQTYGGVQTYRDAYGGI